MCNEDNRCHAYYYITNGNRCATQNGVYKPEYIQGSGESQYQCMIKGHYQRQYFHYDSSDDTCNCCDSLNNLTTDLFSDDDKIYKV